MLLAATPPARAATDPFYLDLLHEGIQSYERADYPAAAKKLRLACFGLLDDPPQLAACLARLGLAQAAAGDSDAFRETFRRIVEVEDRYGAYGRADLPPEVRAAFEQRALAGVPATTLEAIPAFKALLARKLEAQIAALPPRERRHQLEERLAREPRSLAWNVLLVELDLAEGRTAPAVARAEATAAMAPGEPRALCVRGLARAAARRCQEAMPDLEPCWLCGRELAYATALLGCRVELAQWRQADEQVRTLPRGWREDRKVGALIKQVGKHPPATAAAPPAAAPPHGGGARKPPEKSATGAAGASGPARAAAGDPPKPAATKASPSPALPGTAGVPPSPGAAGLQASPVPASPGGASPVPASPGGASPVPASPGGAAAAPPSRGAATPSPSPGPAASLPAPSASAPGPAAAPRALSPAEREAMARSERLLAADDAGGLREALRIARELADAHPDSREAQYVAAEAAYRNSKWKDAAAYFRRGGTPGDDHPELLFYMAVSLYEVGDRPEAAATLRRSLPKLQRTPYVETYVKRILGK
jgi:tetratricopeptide (TPR) repeat protein